MGTTSVTIFNIISAKIIKVYGFTKLGVLAKSLAAALHSKIAIVKVGSWFATLMKYGALQFGILGPWFAPVAISFGIAFAFIPIILVFMPKE